MMWANDVLQRMVDSESYGDCNRRASWPPSPITAHSFLNRAGSWCALFLRRAEMLAFTDKNE
jgi:hypothetical protein